MDWSNPCVHPVMFVWYTFWNQPSEHMWPILGLFNLHISLSYHSVSIYCQWLHPSMMKSSTGNIFRVSGPLCGEFTGHRWIPLTKARDVELWCVFCSAPEWTDEQTLTMLVIWDAIAPIMTSLWCRLPMATAINQNYAIVRPYNVIELGQDWFRYWFVAWWYQAISWTITNTQWGQW